jgi:hypothetical protein
VRALWHNTDVLNNISLDGPLRAPSWHPTPFGLRSAGLEPWAEELLEFFFTSDA